MCELNPFNRTQIKDQLSQCSTIGEMLKKGRKEGEKGREWALGKETKGAKAKAIERKDSYSPCLLFQVILGLSSTQPQPEKIFRQKQKLLSRFQWEEVVSVQALSSVMSHIPTSPHY